MYLKTLAILASCIAVTSCSDSPVAPSTSQQARNATNEMKAKEGDAHECPIHSIMPHYKKTEFRYRVEQMVTNGKLVVAENTTTSKSRGRVTTVRCTHNSAYKSDGRSLDIGYKLIGSEILPVGPKGAVVGDGPPAIHTDIYLFEIKVNDGDWICKTVLYRGETSLVVWDSDGAFFELGQPEESLKVIAVTGGDTITVRRQINNVVSELVRIKLYGIDAPDKTQDSAGRAQKKLNELVFDKSVILTVVNTDRLGRRVCKVYVDEGGERNYINLKIVESGFAQHSRSSAPTAVDLAKAEAEARKNRLGVWKDRI